MSKRKRELMREERMDAPEPDNPPEDTAEGSTEPEGVDEPAYDAQLHVQILTEQVAYLRTQCFMALQKVAAAKVLAGDISYDGGGVWVNTEAGKVDATLGAIARQQAERGSNG